MRRIVGESSTTRIWLILISSDTVADLQLADFTRRQERNGKSGEGMTGTAIVRESTELPKSTA
jgi:hypothetical protein